MSRDRRVVRGRLAGFSPVRSNRVIRSSRTAMRASSSESRASSIFAERSAACCRPRSFAFTFSSSFKCSWNSLADASCLAEAAGDCRFGVAGALAGLTGAFAVLRAGCLAVGFAAVSFGPVFVPTIRAITLSSFVGRRDN
jgi:hypothetical protein